MVLTIASILLATVLGVIGQLMLKQGMASMGVLQFSTGAVPSILLRMATSPWVIGGLLVYGSGTFFWLLVLNRVPLSYSYPFIALGIVVGFLAAWIIFRESIPPSRWIGMAVIVAGLLLVART
jgi:multidrug transporter EmrE-like cation transporter